MWSGIAQVSAKLLYLILVVDQFCTHGIKCVATAARTAAATTAAAPRPDVPASRAAARRVLGANAVFHLADVGPS